ncbi:MAG: alpha/beta hydrolase-fold protein [Candidatus Limivivens sp.]|nr:alpha/beta hydrolase-fold protein [Candidatus Limivivens sp.]
MVHIWDITIPELTGDETRKAYLYLPESYEWDQNRRYPVLYMFDGHNVFFDSHATYGKSWGMKEYMDYTRTQLIIAAVECNHSPDNGRLREYSPFSFQDPKLGKITGQGQETMEWLIHTFKKEIDQNFRTMPEREHTFIAGSSMGGLMSLYAVLEYNQVFSRAAALSPSIWIATDKIRNMIARAEIEPDTVIYMDYGSREIKFHANMRQQFKNTASQLLDRQVLLDCRIVPGGNHCEESWEKQIPFFMNTLMYEA